MHKPAQVKSSIEGEGGTECGAAPSEKLTMAVCWTCSRETLCREYVICCSGSLFHLCPDCEALAAKDEPEGSTSAPADSGRHATLDLTT